MSGRLTMILVGAGDALSVVEGFAIISHVNRPSCKPAPAHILGVIDRT